MSETTAIKLKFLGREIQVGCKAEEKDALMRAAEYVNSEMQSIKSRGGNPSVHRYFSTWTFFPHRPVQRAGRR